MKVRCVNNEGFPLTVGSWYDVKTQYSDGYLVVNDYGNACIYTREFFELVKEEL